MILNALREAKALLLPVDCAGCKAPDLALCSSCRVELVPVITPRSTAQGLVVHTALRYESMMRRVLLSFKEEGRTDTARALAEPLMAAVSARRAAFPGAVIVAIPSTRSAYRRRGFCPLELLLHRARIDYVRGLRVVKRTGTQKSLNIHARALNAHGIFSARRRIAQREVILVDDVLTTGATLDDAARAVRAGGGTVVSAVALAFTPRLLGNRDFPLAEDYL